ncbi:uncharacterized protein [Trachinotus anak]|uniref:uncharacterized protein n=1 Tax=Trachinotus anak TaxID=443729 RepID=UPI0039F228C4
MEGNAEAMEKTTVVEKIPDCAALLQPVNSDVNCELIPEDQLGDLRCSDIDVPMFTPDVFETVFQSFISNITKEQWMILAAGNIDADMIKLLSTACKDILDAITVLVMEVVEPQVVARVQDNFSKDTPNNVSPALIRNYYCVTEEDIQATLGDSVHLSFVAVLKVQQERSITKKLTELFAAEVKERVNHQLTLIEGVESNSQPEEPKPQPQTCESHIMDMVYLIVHILKRATDVPGSPEDQDSLGSNSSGSSSDEEMEGQDFNEDEGTYQPDSVTSDESSDSLESPEDTGCQGSNCSGGCCPKEVTEVQEFSAKDTHVQTDSLPSESSLDVFESTDYQEFLYSSCLGGCCSDKVREVQDLNHNATDDKGCLGSSFPQGCCPVELLEVQDFSDEDAIDEAVTFISQRQSADVPANQSAKPSARSEEEMPGQDRTFLAVFLGKLVEHIASSTKTSIFDVDFDRMLTRLKERTRGKLCSTLPQTVGKIHISVYKNLCLEFGSAKLLQAAMASGDGTFEDAVMKTLKMKLLKSTEKTSSFGKKVKKFFSRRDTKVSPSCEVSNASVSRHEVIDQDDGSGPLPPSNKQTRPAIVRMFCTVARFLRKPFACCTSEASQE